jgi:hypothetical protein
MLGRFLLGGVAGWIWERLSSPNLPGALKGIPFRPIYGFGAAVAQGSLSRNLILSMAFEQLAALKYGDGALWSYDVDDVLTFNHAVDPRNSVLFGLAMSVFDAGASYVKGPILK